MHIFQLPVHLISPLFDFCLVAARDVTRNQFLLDLVIAHKTLQWEFCMESRLLSYIACINKATTDYSHFLYNALLCIIGNVSVLYETDTIYAEILFIFLY